MTDRSKRKRHSDQIGVDVAMDFMHISTDELCQVIECKGNQTQFALSGQLPNKHVRDALDQFRRFSSNTANSDSTDAVRCGAWNYEQDRILRTLVAILMLPSLLEATGIVRDVVPIVIEYVGLPAIQDQISKLKSVLTKKPKQ